MTKHTGRLNTAVRVTAPGKINLSLTVGPRQDDGYHQLNNIFLAVSLTEQVTARLQPDNVFTVSVSTEPTADAQSSTIPVDEQNIAIRAARLLADTARISQGVDLEIQKTVPVAGGMAGGSADAAAALVACDALWGTQLAREELAQLAAELGADVPFSLLGGAAIGTGTGSELSPIFAPATFHWVLVLADFGLSTAEVFATLDELRSDQEVAIPEITSAALLKALHAGNPEELASHMRNDLETAALHLAPELKQTLADGYDCGATAAQISGSGPTAMLLAEDASDAQILANKMIQRGHQAIVVNSPAPGARKVNTLG